MYTGAKTVFRTVYEVKVGMHHGSALSPLIFVIVMEAISREFRVARPWELLYADDLAVIAETEEELIKRLNEWKDKDVSLIMRGRLYSSCVQSSMLHGSEIWPVRKEHVVALQPAEMRMVRWMCGVKLKDRLPSKVLRERLGIDDIALVLQQNRLHWYGRVLRKDDDDWVKKCIEYEVRVQDQRGPGERLSERIVKHVK